MGPGVVIGADLGGTKFIAGLVTPDGRILTRHRATVPTSREFDAVVESVARTIESCYVPGSERPQAVGIGVAGQVDPASGIVHHAPNLRWKDVPFGPRLSARLGIPVVVANDAHTITIGEWRFGAGRGHDHLLCLCIGTGVGGGVIADGELLRGATHAAGEVGHTVLVVHGRPCHCPSRGCLEAYVGGWAIEERVREAARERPEEAAALLARCGGIERLTPLAVEQAARDGERFAREFLDRVAEEFAAGLVGLVNAFNPETVIVTGKIAEGFPEFILRGREAVRTSCQPPASTARVLPSWLGADAGILGAASLARDALPSEAPA